MKNNFDLKKFLVENKLTANSKMTNEQAKEMMFDGILGLHVGDVAGVSVYSLETSDVYDTLYYGTLDVSGTKNVVAVDVAGEQQTPEDVIRAGVSSKELASFIANDINNELER